MNALQERAFYKTRWLIRRFADDAAFARDKPASGGRRRATAATRVDYRWQPAAH